MTKKTTKLARRYGGKIQDDGSYLFVRGPEADRVGGPYTAVLRFCAAAERAGIATRFGGLRAWVLL